MCFSSSLHLPSHYCQGDNTAYKLAEHSHLPWLKSGQQVQNAEGAEGSATGREIHKVTCMSPCVSLSWETGL